MMKPIRQKRPRALLICCEGKTEKAYFDIVSDFYRTPYVLVETYDRQGQHFALIDKTIARRSICCADNELASADVECWAVCDDDGMDCSFTELTGMP